METVTVYFDYLCPYAYRAMELSTMLTEPLKLEFNWSNYSLHQGNYQGNGWFLWENKLNLNDKDGGKGLLPFLASYAVRKQSESSFGLYRLMLMRAYHRDGKPYSINTIMDVAEQVGLDLDLLERELDTEITRKMLAKDHQHAIKKQVFASPTFEFKNNNLSYFRFSEVPASQDKAINFFLDYKNILERYPYIQSIRRPNVTQTLIGRTANGNQVRQANT